LPATARPMPRDPPVTMATDMTDPFDDTKSLFR
jgi:hypothetical protein